MDLRIKDNVPLKVLEKYGWELDNTHCPTYYRCNECPDIENCFVYKEQRYYKYISKFLKDTKIYVANYSKEIRGMNAAYEVIYNTNDNYKYIIKACQEEIKAGIIEMC